VQYTRRPRSADGAFWPFSTRAAVFAVPVIFVALVVSFGITRGATDWPDARFDGWVLLGIVGLSLVPILLVILNSVATQGGSLEAFGVKIRWASLVSTSAVTVPPRLGVMEGIPMRDSASVEILETLRSATRSDVVVVDLEQGQAWWETRLLVLCAGAVRLGQPAAVVFVAAERATAKCFQGWATPQELVRGLLAARHDLRDAYERAQVEARRWELAQPPQQPQDPNPQFPWPRPDTSKRFIAFPGSERNTLAPEQLLADELGQLEVPTPNGITLVRLSELFAPYLRTTALEESADDETWIDTVLGTVDPYVAVTRSREYAGLLPRERANNDILRGLITPLQSSTTE
jgi:hypothetical protein